MPNKTEILIPKHGRGSYTNKLPKVTDQEKLERISSNKYISHSSRSRIVHYSKPEKKKIQKKRRFNNEVENDNNPLAKLNFAGHANTNNQNSSGDLRKWTQHKSEKHKSAVKQRRGSCLSGVRQGKHGGNPSYAPEGDKGRWIRVYEAKVAQIYEHHRCRMSKKMKLARGGSYFDEDEGPEDIDADTTLNEFNQIQLKINSKHHLRTAFETSRLAPSPTPEDQDSFQLNNKEKRHTAPPKFTEPKRWGATLHRNKLCEACSIHCSVDHRTVFACAYCSTIWHLSCLRTNCGDHNFIPTHSNTYACDECREEINFSRNEFEKNKLEIYQGHLEAYYASLVAAKWRQHVAAHRYYTMRRFLVRLQAMARAFKLRHAFRAQRRALPRPMKLHLKCANNLSIADWDTQKADPYVIITILDAKDKQIWRFDSICMINDLNPIFDQTFLIPGVPGQSKLVMTVVDKDDLRDQFLGQAYLDLCPHPTREIFRTGGKFKCALDDLFYMPCESSGADQRLDFSDIVPKGDVEIEVEPLVGTMNLCGHLIGPPLDDEATFASFKVVETRKLRKCWCVLADHKLLLYTSFANTQPKLEIELKQATVEIKLEERHTPFTVTAKNGAEYTFICPNSNERDKWRMALEGSYDFTNFKREKSGRDRINAIVESTHRKTISKKDTKNIKLQRLKRQKKKQESKNQLESEAGGGGGLTVTTNSEMNAEIRGFIPIATPYENVVSGGVGGRKSRSPTAIVSSHNATKKEFQLLKEQHLKKTLCKEKETEMKMKKKKGKRTKLPKILTT